MTARQFGLSAKCLGSTSATETSVQVCTPSDILVLREPTTFSPPNETSREATAGVHPLPGSHGAYAIQRANSNSSPAISSLPANLALLRAPFYRRAIELLKALNVAQALRDVFLALGVLLLLLIVLGAVPLAIGMMLFVYFQ